MNNKPNALDIIKEIKSKFAPSISMELIERIFRLEERVQFDGNRGDAPGKIQQVIQAELDKEFLKGS